MWTTARFSKSAPILKLLHDSHTRIVSEPRPLVAVVAAPVAGQSLLGKPNKLRIFTGELGKQRCLVGRECSLDRANNFDYVFAYELNNKWYLPDGSDREQRPQ
jgi:hypothetical protein